jgi:site-specific recombinase XerD
LTIPIQGYDFPPAGAGDTSGPCPRLQAVRSLAQAVTATADELRSFQLHLTETGASATTRNRTMTGLRFLFRITLRRLDLLPEMYHVKEPQKVPLILNQDEARRLLAMTDNVRNRLLLSIGYGAGLRAGEVVRLKVKHIDSAQMIIRVEQSKGQKDRLVMLSPETLALLQEWWPLRTNKYDLGVPMAERWLFPGRRKGHLTPRQLNRLFHEAAASRRPSTCTRFGTALPRTSMIAVSTSE